MPRATTSEATRILTYFLTAALSEAQLLFGLVKDQMTLRVAAEAPPVEKVRKVRKPRAPRPGPVPQAQPPVNEATPLADQPTGRRKRTPKPAPAADLPLQDGGEPPAAPGEYGG